MQRSLRPSRPATGLADQAAEVIHRRDAPARNVSVHRLHGVQAALTAQAQFGEPPSNRSRTRPEPSGFAESRSAFFARSSRQRSSAFATPWNTLAPQPYSGPLSYVAQARYTGASVDTTQGESFGDLLDLEADWLEPWFGTSGGR